MNSIQHRPEQPGDQLILQLDETFAFVRNLLVSLHLGAAGIFIALNIHELPMVFPFGHAAPVVVGFVPVLGVRARDIQ